MNGVCDEIRQQLAAYQCGELTELEAEAVRLHLDACPACRMEAEQTERVRKALRRNLPPLQAPEGFLSRLRDRMQREGVTEHTRANGDPQNGAAAKRAGDAKFSSGRVFTQPHTVRSRFAATVRRSPYFAASLALHVAAAAVVVILLIRLQGTPDERVVVQGPQTPMPAFEVREFSTAWTERRDCPKVTVQGVRVADGVLIDCPQMLTDGALALVDDPELGCVKGYQPQAGAVGRTAEVKNARIVIPSELADRRLTAEAAEQDKSQPLAIKVLELEDRVEFWAERRWEGFAAKHAAATAQMRVPQESSPAARLAVPALAAVASCGQGRGERRAGC